MKPTKQFWSWFAQVTALMLLVFRADVVFTMLKLIPNLDWGQVLNQLQLGIAGFVLFVILWAAWLIWRAVDGFFGKGDFMSDTSARRW